MLFMDYFISSSKKSLPLDISDLRTPQAAQFSENSLENFNEALGHIINFLDLETGNSFFLENFLSWTHLQKNEPNAKKIKETDILTETFEFSENLLVKEQSATETFINSLFNFEKSKQLSFAEKNGDYYIFSQKFLNYLYKYTVTVKTFSYNPSGVLITLDFNNMDDTNKKRRELFYLKKSGKTILVFHCMTLKNFFLPFPEKLYQKILVNLSLKPDFNFQPMKILKPV